jgi:hypothetical protein
MPAPAHRSITIDRLEIDVHGVDAGTVQRALGALPASIAAALGSTRPAVRDGSGRGASTASLRMNPSANDLARAVAGDIADEDTKAIKARRVRRGGDA